MGYTESEERDPLLNPVNEEVATVVREGPRRTATFFSSCVNLSNTILGAGMLGLPYAVSVCGYGLGSIFLILSACASAFGLYLLVQCSDRCKTTASYYVCAKQTYPHFAFVIDVVVLIKCFGVAISYLIVIGDLMPYVMSQLLNRDVSDEIIGSFRLWIAIFGVVIIPLAFLRQLNSLRFTSLLALGTVAYLVCLVVAYFFLVEGEATGIKGFQFQTKIFSVLTIFVFGFTCHQNIFSIYNELMDPSPRRINGVIFLSVSICLSVYFLVALFGYFTYGENVQDNIINNYPVEPAVTVGRIFISILVAFSYPLQTHPSRICLDNLYRVVHSEWMKKEFTPQTTRRYLIETIVLITATFVIGLTVTDLAVVLALVGATGSTTMCYILPGLFYLKMESHTPWNITKTFAAILCVVGVFIMPTAIVFIFYDPDASP